MIRGLVSATKAPTLERTVASGEAETGLRRVDDTVPKGRSRPPIRPIRPPAPRAKMCRSRSPT